MKTKLLTIAPTLALAVFTYCGTVNAQENRGHKHNHDEVVLGKFTIGKNAVEASQGHGSVKAGKEGHLVIKLVKKDKGGSIIRAWIGTKDRTLSAVGKAKYSAKKGTYDVHAVAPKPLPKDAKWWVEIIDSNGKKSVDSIPLLKNVKKADTHSHGHGNHSH